MRGMLQPGIRPRHSLVFCVQRQKEKEETTVKKVEVGVRTPDLLDSSILSPWQSWDHSVLETDSHPHYPMGSDVSRRYSHMTIGI